MAAQHPVASAGRPAPPAGAALWVPRLDRASTMPLSRQLASELRQALAGGSFGAGARLPSTRSLATELGIARSTVVAVFEQLAAEGYIEPRQGAGYFVATPLTPHAGSASDNEAVPAARVTSRHAQSLRLVMPDWRKSPRPFETGHAEVDNRLIASWKRLASRALSARTRLNWDYGDPQGEPALRRAIAEYLWAARGVRCRPEQIIVTSGTQQGLSLAARILIEPGDPVWVEDPCYRSAVEILRAAESCIVPVPVDASGLDIATASGSTNRRRGWCTRPHRGNTRSAWRCRSRAAANCSIGPSASVAGLSRTITKASFSSLAVRCRHCRASTGLGGSSISARSANYCSRRCGSATRYCRTIWSSHLLRRGI